MSPNADEFNSDELDAPEWLNAEFFVEVLANCEPNSRGLVVKHFELTPAAAKGDHYASVMFRASAEYCVGDVSKTRSLIVKAMPDVEGPKKAHLSSLHIFETEIGMYSEVLPRFEQILREVGDDTVLMAPCIYYQLSPRKVIVFEDIVPLGYTVLRNRMVNEEEIKCVFVKIAKWHAVSYKLRSEEPEFFDKYRHGLLNMPNLKENGFFMDGIKYFPSLFKSEPKLKEFVPYFEKLQPVLVDMCQASVNEYRVDPQPDTYYVLCHGDIHSKNMMFKRNQSSGKLEDVMLLDFQFCYLGPIVLDLMYSFFTLFSIEMSDDFPAYLHFYFTNFTETLEKIGYKGPMPKLLKLREQFMKYKHYELFLLITLMPLWYAFLMGTCDPAELVSVVERRLSLYKRPEYIKQLKKVLPKYLHLGYFEDLTEQDSN